MQKHALLIGVNQYGPDSHLVNLNYAEADAVALGNVLQGQFGFKVKTLLGGQATRSGILRQLHSLSQLAGTSKDDIVLFFFAGHGQSIHGRYVLHPYGAFANEDIDSLVFSELLTVFRSRFQSGQILCIIDACHNELRVGGTRGDNPLTDISRDVKYVKNQESGEKVIKSLLSCSEGQVSWETEEYGHGVFTKFLLDILQDKCHTQSFDDAIRDLGQFIPRYVKQKYGVTQTPWWESPLSSKTWLKKITNNPSKTNSITNSFKLTDSKFSLDVLKASGILEEYIKGGGKTSGKAWFNFFESIYKKFEIKNILELKQLVDSINSKFKETEENKKLKALIEEKKHKAVREMIFIKGGWFEMGNNSYVDQSPKHRIYISGFYMDTHQVTNIIFAKFLNEYGDYKVKSGDFAGKIMIYNNDWGIKKSKGKWFVNSGLSNHPVINVTWYGANEFAKFYNKRLPTEAEWEYAAHGGHKSKGFKYSGSNNMAKAGWYGQSYSSYYPYKTHKVGKRLVNELGLYDMSGNVWEWCNDFYARKYYKSSPEKNPQGPELGTKRVLRGGSWNDSVDNCQITTRKSLSPTSKSDIVGFRCVYDNK